MYRWRIGAVHPLPDPLDRDALETVAVCERQEVGTDRTRVHPAIGSDPGRDCLELRSSASAR
jgi:hypothetical protein